MFDALPEQMATPFAALPATHDEIEGLYGHLESVMTETGYGCGDANCANRR